MMPAESRGIVGGGRIGANGHGPWMRGIGSAARGGGIGSAARGGWHRERRRARRWHRERHARRWHRQRRARRWRRWRWWRRWLRSRWWHIRVNAHGDWRRRRWRRVGVDLHGGGGRSGSVLGGVGEARNTKRSEKTDHFHVTSEARASCELAS